MALNIKNEQTVDAARRLAALTGESLTQAIDVAVRERLARMEQGSMSDRLSALEELSGRTSALWPADGTDPTEYLYDAETGLPA